MELASIKVLFDSRRIRVLPLRVHDEPFRGPGVDLLGAEGADVLAELGEALTRWFSERGGGAPRSIVFHFEDRSVIATSAATENGGRPMVTRLDAHSSQDLFDLLAPVLPKIRGRTEEALRRRATS